MTESPDQADLPEDFDERLWVETDHILRPEARLYLGYNPHTFRGRFAAWSPLAQRTLFLSKSDITAASDLAWAWIDGYLKGCEPEPELMFGDSIYGKDDAQDWRWQRWRDAIQTLRDSGEWNGRRWITLTPFGPGDGVT